VLAGADRLGQQGGAHLRGAGVEEDRVVLVLQRRVEVGAPARDAVRLGQRLDLLGVAADEDRVGMTLSPLEGVTPPCARSRRWSGSVLVHAHASW
jgi:hypothetical protein